MFMWMSDKLFWRVVRRDVTGGCEIIGLASGRSTFLISFSGDWSVGVSVEVMS
jgi:hypothetical protein